jgi:hypothetical protein
VRHHLPVPIDSPSSGGSAPAVDDSSAPVFGTGSAAVPPVRHRPAPAPQPRAAALFVALAGAGAVAVLVAMVKGETSLALVVPGGKLIVLGRIAALMGAYVILVMLFLIARLPWLERAVGQERLVWWHQRLAPWALWLIVAGIQNRAAAPTVGLSHVLP